MYQRWVLALVAAVAIGSSSARAQWVAARLPAEYEHANFEILAVPADRDSPGVFERPAWLTLVCQGRRSRVRLMFETYAMAPRTRVLVLFDGNRAVAATANPDGRSVSFDCLGDTHYDGPRLCRAIARGASLRLRVEREYAPALTYNFDVETGREPSMFAECPAFAR